MDVLEEKKIEKYLSDKNLPLDLYLEIKEHIVLQIEDLQRTKAMHFESAFQQVQKVWQKELAFDSSSILVNNPNQIPKIVARIRQVYLKEIFPKILLLSVMPVVLLVVFANFLNKNQFHILFGVFYIGIIVIPFLIVIFNYKILRIASQWKKGELNGHCFTKCVS